MLQRDFFPEWSGVVGVEIVEGSRYITLDCSLVT